MCTMRTLPSILLAVAVLGCSPAPASSNVAAPATPAVAGNGAGVADNAAASIVPVTRVFDGDTAEVEWDAPPMPWRLRLLCIDTVERGQPGYKESGAALAAMIGGEPVRLEFDPTMDTRDHFGRLLVYVWSEDGRCLNVEMVRAGWSKFYTKYGEGMHAAAFREAEAEARAAQRGVWATGETTLPR